MLDSQSVTVFHNESHVKVRIMCNHYRPLAEFKEFWQNFFDCRRIHYHAVINACKLFNTERDRYFWVYKRGKTIGNLSVLYQYRANLNNLTGQRREACCLNIKDYKSSIQFLSFSICHHTL